MVLRNFGLILNLIFLLILTACISTPEEPETQIINGQSRERRSMMEQLPLGDEYYGPGQPRVEVRRISADRNGNVYVIGTFTLTVDFDPGEGVEERTTENHHTGFLLKLDSDGEFEWVRHVKVKIQDLKTPQWISSDPRIYITGRYYDSMDLETGQAEMYTLNTGTGNSAYVAIYDQNGDLQWAEGWANNIPGTEGGGCQVYPTKSGELYTVSDSWIPRGSRQKILKCFDSGGQLKWDRSYNIDRSAHSGTSIVVDKDGVVYTIIPGAVYSRNDPDLAEVSVSNFGPGQTGQEYPERLVWSFFGTENWIEEREFVRGRYGTDRLFPDPEGGVQILDNSGFDFDIDPGPREIIPDCRSCDLMRWFNAEGELKMARSWSETNLKVLVDSEGNTYGIDTDPFYHIAFNDPITAVLGIAEVNYTESKSFFTPAMALVKFDEDLNELWMLNWKVSDDMLRYNIDRRGNVIIGGVFKQDTDFGPGDLVDERNPIGGQDGFVMKVKTNGTVDWVVTLGGHIDYEDEISVDGSAVEVEEVEIINE